MKNNFGKETRRTVTRLTLLGGLLLLTACGGKVPNEVEATSTATTSSGCPSTTIPVRIESGDTPIGICREVLGENGTDANALQCARTSPVVTTRSGRGYEVGNGKWILYPGGGENGYEPTELQIGDTFCANVEP